MGPSADDVLDGDDHEHTAARDPLDGRRPTLSGDLREMVGFGPVFRRSVGGYDRFAVDTYVRWAESELATAGRMREEMLTRIGRLRADLDEARRQMAQSAGVREALRLVPRIGWVLAAAADQADDMRADADAERAAATAEAERLVSEATEEARRIVAEATAEAATILTSARAEAERLAAEADAVVAEAGRTAEEARAEACRRHAEITALEQRAADEAERTRQAAQRDADAARMQARDDAIAMFTAAREERRRADAAAQAARAALRAEIEQLELRRSAAGPTDPGPVPAEEPTLPIPRPARTGTGVRTGARRTADLLHLGRHRRG